tara:strand:+ start:395 stop:1561 length:1167 start_codon:yes stop_codon:yes gene_type:complete
MCAEPISSKDTYGNEKWANLVLEALPNPLIQLGTNNSIVYLNTAAETFFEASMGYLKGLPFTELIPDNTPLLEMVKNVRHSGNSITDHDLVLEGIRIGVRIVNVGVSPLPAKDGHIVISFFERSLAQRLHNQQQSRGAARSVSGMAAMLAHEVKNPLSGIKGAAQLLAQTIDEQDQPLAKLICDETDRICELVDKMEGFADERPLKRGEVNIHEILNHCIRLATAGFGNRVKFKEEYDPSLPATLGNKDVLIQLFLNLLKNACEAISAEKGEVKITTSYRQGMSVKVGGSRDRLGLPLMITIQDNGIGIPSELLDNLFDPFVTTKSNGTGLGLAFVAKAIADHGGFVEVETLPRLTTFRVMLPMFDSKNFYNGQKDVFQKFLKPDEVQ